jgi:outer membrane protein OmpA-like peptidoglycan-associated protein
MKKLNILIAILMLSVSFSFAQDTERYTIKLLEECNDNLSNFGTTFYGENQVIYSSPKKGIQIVKNKWKPNDQPYLELYLADMQEDGELVNRKKIGKDVNSKYHESNVAFTNDMSTVYFSRDKYYDKKLDKDNQGVTHISMYRADVVSPTEWTNVVPMPFNNKEYSVGHPTLSADNNTLYFSSNMNGNDDIYYVKILGDGAYGDPVNLRQVNTDGSERFPFMAENNMLYFSSDKSGGMGKLDVYVVKLDGHSAPVNLGMPINSYNDDFAFTLKKGADYGYFSSNRGSGKGDDDIYYFKQTGDLPCNQIAEGIVTDKNSGRRIPRALVVLYDENGKELDSQVVGEDAKFVFDIDCTSKYKVVGSKEMYSEDSKEFVSNANLELGLDLGLAIEKAMDNPKSVTASQYDQCQGALDLINNIYFDLDKSYIRADAASELDKVIKIMKRCKNIHVEASSHTDSRASHEYNEALSERRARETVNYIVNVGGIDGTRINAVGYGETRLRNRCSDGVRCTEAEHQMNRRTQFDITNF